MQEQDHPMKYVWDYVKFRNPGSVEGKFWTDNIDEHFKISINGCNEDIEGTPFGHIAIDHDNFPFALFTIYGEGEVINFRDVTLEDFKNAVTARIAKGN